jgi:hypothetical protein
MDRRTLSDRLPGDRIRRRLPVGRPGEGDDEQADDSGGVSMDTSDIPGVSDDGTELDFSALGGEEDGDDETRDRLRLALLALAGLGALVTLVAVIAQFVLGSGDEDEEDDEDEETTGAVVDDEDEGSESEADDTDWSVEDTDEPEPAATEADDESTGTTADEDEEVPADVDEAQARPESVGEEGFDEGTAAIVGLAFLLAATAARRWAESDDRSEE